VPRRSRRNPFPPREERREKEGTKKQPILLPLPNPACRSPPTNCVRRPLGAGGSVDPDPIPHVPSGRLGLDEVFPLSQHRAVRRSLALKSHISFNTRGPRSATSRPPIYDRTHFASDDHATQPTMLHFYFYSTQHQGRFSFQSPGERGERSGGGGGRTASYGGGGGGPAGRGGCAGKWQRKQFILDIGSRESEKIIFWVSRRGVEILNAL